MAAPPIPKVNFSFPNNNLGQTPPSPGNIIAVIGPCTGPIAVATPRTVGGSAGNVVTLAGYGPAADLGANLVQGGATVVIVRCAYTPATPTAVTKTGGGISVMTVTGSPFDRYMKINVRVTRSASVGDSPPPRIRISLDGGLTETGDLNVPVDGVYSGLASTTGMTLHFTVATMVEGALYTFSVPYPTVAASDMAVAAVALRASTEVYSMLYFAAPLSRTGVETVVSAVGTFAEKKRFVRCFTESVDANGDTEADWMADLSADFEGFATDLGVVSAGYAPVRSIVLGSVMWRSIGWMGAVRASLVAISRDLGARADNGLVSYKGSVYVTNPNSLDYTLPDGLFIHDESLVPGLNADQFMTIMSEQGLTGFYFITNPNLMSGPISDYTLLQFGRISDEIARLTNAYLTLQLSSDVLLNPTTGKILDKERTKWEQGNDTYLEPLVRYQNVSGLATAVGGDSNIINNEPVPVDVRWQPKGYPKVFNAKISVVRTLA